jgi:hypothetical protein
MADNLWLGAVRKGLAANKPTVPDCSADTFQFYFETDTGKLNYAPSGASAWRSLGGGSAGIQPTPTAKTGSATLTIAELQTRIITATSASAVALTLPTGTLTDAGVLGGASNNDESFEWTVINLGSSSGAVTMTAGTDHTYVGAAVVAIATSARFRTRKTAANTFVTYRIA